MSKPIIVIDVDGVLLDFNKSFTVWWNNRYSKLYNFNMAYNPLVWNYGFNNETILKNHITEFINTDPFLDIIDNDFPKLINELSKTYEINIITAYHREESRKYNLEKYDIKYDKIYFATNSNKVDVIKSVNPSIIIEDCPLHVNKLINENKYKIYVPIFWNYTKEIENDKVCKYNSVLDLWNELI